MSRNRDGSYRCDDCPKDAQPGIRVTATPALGIGSVSTWEVFCPNGHIVKPEFGLQFLVLPGGRI